MNFIAKLRNGPSHRALCGALCVAVLAAASAVCLAPARAATTDVSQVPLVTSTSLAVKPNLMYIMDTSGSMNWPFMPDCVGLPKGSECGQISPLPTNGQQIPSNGYSGNACFKNSIFNGVYYNPNYTYAVPVDYLGNPYPSASFTAAPYDGFNSSKKNPNTNTTTTDLSAKFQAYDTTVDAASQISGQDTAQPAYYYKYTGSNPATPSNAYCYVDTNYTKVVVSATSGPGGTDERQNFANWYTYYRTRILFSKTSIGIAFNGLTSSYRIGFTNIYNSSWGSANSQYLPITEFTTDSDLSKTNPATGQPYQKVACDANSTSTTTTQKSCFYSTIYGQVANGSTPLQEAVDAIGKLYQKTLSGAPDPIQYSCQRNFAILSTDGYWNGSYNGVGDTDGNTSTVNGTSVSPTPRPFFDGGYSGSSNTLADVAYYYWATDLRPAGTTGVLGTDVSNNNVHPGPSDPATWQHMDLFTVGLGANGVMSYLSNYDDPTTNYGDYYKILTNASSCVNASGTKFNSDGKCNWPVPTSNQPTTIDDLWHAAVNGHGKYFSVKDPGALRDGFLEILSKINAVQGTDAAAAASNPNIVAGDNYLFESSFTTSQWYGDVIRVTISVNTGAPGGTDWSAQAQLDSLPLSNRAIYMYAPTNTNKLARFTWANLSSAQQTSFTNAISKLGQYTNYNAAQKAAATGAALVSYVAGDRSNEIDSTNTAATTSLFRTRTHILGDIINAEAAYVKRPLQSYGDAGYTAYITAQANRQGVVYVGANDGMLHAFNSDTGAEMWAYVPSAVMPNLYMLADQYYGGTHQYYVDGTPVTGDIAVGGQWKTILVGGFNAGGRGYYALDVTNPSSPVALWEFSSDPNMGYSFGNPVITKNAAGNWVVLVTSGYNNVNPGDGIGHLYVLDAATGTLLQNIKTGAGSTTTPSGLSKIAAWADNATVDNTMLRVYGGDLFGNLWRFDPDVRITGDTTMVTTLATLKDPNGIAQPITAKPEIGDVGTNGASIPMVFVGTGEYLGTTDVTSIQVQTFYGIRDLLTTSGWGNVRTNTTFVQQTFTTLTGSSGQKVRTTSSNTVDLAGGTNNGWYINLPDTGERLNTDPTLDLGVLTFTTNIPTSDACTAGGYSWLNYLDFRTGSFLAASPSNVGSVFLGNEIATRPVVVRLPSGKLVSIVRGSNGDTFINGLPQTSTSSGTRVNWREIFQ